MFSAHLQAVAVDGPSVFSHGENCKKTAKKGISLRPRQHQPRQKLSEQKPLVWGITGDSFWAPRFGALGEFKLVEWPKLTRWAGVSNAKFWVATHLFPEVTDHPLLHLATKTLQALTGLVCLISAWPPGAR